MNIALSTIRVVRSPLQRGKTLEEQIGKGKIDGSYRFSGELLQ